MQTNQEKLKQILAREPFYNRQRISKYRQGWKDFWATKKSGYVKFPWFKFALYSPIYLAIFIAQLFIKKDDRLPKWVNKTGVINYYNLTPKQQEWWDKHWGKSDFADPLQWIKTLSQKEQDELLEEVKRQTAQRDIIRAEMWKKRNATWKPVVDAFKKDVEI